MTGNMCNVVIHGTHTHTRVFFAAELTPGHGPHVNERLEHMLLFHRFMRILFRKFRHLI